LPIRGSGRLAQALGVIFKRIAQHGGDMRKRRCFGCIMVGFAGLGLAAIGFLIAWLGYFHFGYALMFSGSVVGGAGIVSQWVTADPS
jgi:hypothetical protein